MHFYFFCTFGYSVQSVLAIMWNIDAIIFAY